MVTLAMKSLLLKTMGVKCTLESGLSLYAISGHNTSMVADYHNPYDAVDVDYMWVTTQDAVDKAELQYEDIMTSAENNRFKVINWIPDDTGWVTIKASWLGHIKDNE